DDHQKDRERSRHPLLQPGHQRIKPKRQEQRHTDVDENGAELSDNATDYQGGENAQTADEADAERINTEAGGIAAGLNGDVWFQVLRVSDHLLAISSHGRLRALR